VYALPDSAREWGKLQIQLEFWGGWSFNPDEDLTRALSNITQPIHVEFAPLGIIGLSIRPSWPWQGRFAALAQSSKQLSWGFLIARNLAICGPVICVRPAGRRMPPVSTHLHTGLWSLPQFALYFSPEIAILLRRHRNLMLWNGALIQVETHPRRSNTV
jgi:hypothetical protein